MGSPKRAAIAFLFYLIGFSVPFLLENAGELSEYLPERFHEAVTTLAIAYQRWSAGPRGIEPRFTAFVALNEKSFPSTLGNSCRQRELFTELLPRLAEEQPSVIVIDLEFLWDGCPPDQYQHWTEQLKKVMESISARTPVVIGQSTRIVSELPDEQRRRAAEEGVPGNALVLRPIIELPSSSDIHIGLTRLNHDLRRVALEWASYRNDDSHFAFSGMMPSLALVAARIGRAGFPSGTDSIDRFVRNGTHPYTNLMPPRKFIRVDAAELMCGTDFRNEPCRDNALSEKLRGKVVVAGWEDDPTDNHETVVGRMPGALLHANAIESLLDGRLLHPVGLALQIGLSLLWFVLVEWPFHVWKESLDRAFLVSILMFMGVSFLLYYVLVVNMGWYLALLPPSFVGLLLRYWHQRSEGGTTPHERRRHRAPQDESRRVAQPHPAGRRG